MWKTPAAAARIVITKEFPLSLKTPIHPHIVILNVVQLESREALWKLQQHKSYTIRRSGVMTTRGIRRKKSYLVDAKIAVCGQKSVGKSGKSFYPHIIFFLLLFIYLCKKYAHDEAKIIFVYEQEEKFVHLEPFFSLSFHIAREKNVKSTQKNLFSFSFTRTLSITVKKICETLFRPRKFTLIKAHKKNQFMVSRRMMICSTYTWGNSRFLNQPINCRVYII